MWPGVHSTLAAPDTSSQPKSEPHQLDSQRRRSSFAISAQWPLRSRKEETGGAGRRRACGAGRDGRASRLQPKAAAAPAALKDAWPWRWRPWWWPCGRRTRAATVVIVAVAADASRLWTCCYGAMCAAAPAPPCLARPGTPPHAPHAACSPKFGSAPRPAQAAHLAKLVRAPCALPCLLTWLLVPPPPLLHLGCLDRAIPRVSQRTAAVGAPRDGREGAAEGCLWTGCALVKPRC